nr:5409_t:CDS:2 [Entrophospora candida]
MDNDGGNSSFSSSSSSSGSSSNSSSQTGQTGTAYCICPIIPFKNKEKIREQLAKAIHKNMGKLSGSCYNDCVANDKKKNIYLRNEISNTNSRLDGLTSSYNISYEEGRVEEYLKTQIEIPPKDCRIM